MNEHTSRELDPGDLLVVKIRGGLTACWKHTSEKFTPIDEATIGHLSNNDIAIFLKIAQGNERRSDELFCLTKFGVGWIYRGDLEILNNDY